MRLDLSILDASYKKWLEEDASMGEILDTKVTKAKNAAFRQKLDSWKNRLNDRVAIKKRNADHGKQLRDFLSD